MSDTAVTTVQQTTTTGVDISAGQGTAIVAANTMVVTPAGPMEELALLFFNTDGAPHVVTFKASLDPPADGRAMEKTAIVSRLLADGAFWTAGICGRIEVGWR